MSTCTELSLKLQREKTFLTHGYSIGVAVSYNWDFLICIRFCATMVILLNPFPALRGWFVYKLSRSAMFTCNYGTGSRSFYCLSNLEFDFFIRLGNWFNCLLLVMHLRSTV